MPLHVGQARPHTGRAMPDAPRARPDATVGDDAGDEALMLAYAAGNAAAFDTLYARHRGGVYRYLVRHVGNASVADELFQDVWMSAIRARASYVPTAKFATWLYTLAHHRLVDHWRSRGAVRLESLDDEGDGGAAALVDAIAGSRTDEPETRATSSAVRVALDAALRELPAAQREAFLLHVESGLSLAEIAKLTGAGEETVKSRVRYAYAKLRASLEDYA